jgi:esterase
MTEPLSRFLESSGGGDSPRLHYLEWNPHGEVTLIALHGNSANAWWWQPMAEAISPRMRIIALDQRGHGDSGWVRPPAYSPREYAADLARFIDACGIERPIVIGHSMGGISALAFAERATDAAIRAAVAIDVAVTSGRTRNRFLRRLKSLPIVSYPDLETAKSRFRLMPQEGDIAPQRLAAIAAHSLSRTDDGRWTLKFDRESFHGSDGLDVLAAIRAVRVPLLLVRGGQSRIMTTEAAQSAVASNPRACLVVIPDTYHHLPLECPDQLARVIERFVAELG